MALSASVSVWGFCISSFRPPHSISLSLSLPLSGKRKNKPIQRIWYLPCFPIEFHRKHRFRSGDPPLSDSYNHFAIVYWRTQSTTKAPIPFFRPHVRKSETKKGKTKRRNLYSFSFSAGCPAPWKLFAWEANLAHSSLLTVLIRDPRNHTHFRSIRPIQPALLWHFRVKGSSRLMNSFDKMPQQKSLDDLLYQRMKNRERQRRYRERKRLQENVKKVAAVNELTSLPLPPPPTSKPTNGLLGGNQSGNRVLCKRDWKKDARAAHMAKQLTSLPAQPIIDVNQGLNLLSGKIITKQNTEMEQILSSHSLSMQNHEKPKIKNGGRHWKAEARNKK